MANITISSPPDTSPFHPTANITTIGREQDIASWEPPSSVDWSRAVRALALNIVKSISRYRAKEILAISKHSLQLLARHEKVSLGGKGARAT